SLALRAPPPDSPPPLPYRRPRPRRSHESDRRSSACREAFVPIPLASSRASRMSAVDDLPPLREVIRRHGLRAKKSLGQNFLLDLNLTARIARAAGPLEGVDAVEIGPRPGRLPPAPPPARARPGPPVQRR